MVRASSKRRLPLSSSADRIQSWRPDESQWQVIDTASDFPLNKPRRQQVIDIVDRYFAAEIFERNAAFADDAEKHLLRIEKAAFALTSAYERMGGHAGFFARREVDLGLKEFSRRHPDLRSTIALVRDVALAARAARDATNSDDAPQFIETSAWRQMIFRLYKMLTDSGMAVGVSKNSEASPSPFTRFVFALQQTFPQTLSRYNHSHGGLAAELSKTLRGAKFEDPLKNNSPEIS